MEFRNVERVSASSERPCRARPFDCNCWLILPRLLAGARNVHTVDRFGTGPSGNPPSASGVDGTASIPRAGLATLRWPLSAPITGARSGLLIDIFDKYSGLESGPSGRAGARTVEETLSAMLDAGAERLGGAAPYERSERRDDTRAGNYEHS
jgi:hypothetical protein